MKSLFSLLLVLFSFVVNAADSEDLFILKKVGHGIQVSVPASTVLSSEESSYRMLIEQPRAFNNLGQQERALLVENHKANVVDLFLATVRQQKTNPFFLLAECKADFCGLTRKADGATEPRSRFETAVINAVSSPLIEKSPREGIELLVFASGGLLTESKIIKSLLTAGVQIKSIRLIDTNYAKIQRLNLDNDARSFNIKSFDTLTNGHDQNNNTSISALIFFELLRLKQFINFIGTNTNQVPIITFYDTEVGLLKDKEEHIFEGGDLLLGIDFMEGDGLVVLEALEAYGKIAINLIPQSGFVATLNSKENQVAGSIVRKTSALGSIALTVDKLFEFSETVPSAAKSDKSPSGIKN